MEMEIEIVDSGLLITVVVFIIILVSTAVYLSCINKTITKSLEEMRKTSPITYECASIIVDAAWRIVVSTLLYLYILAICVIILKS